MKFYLQVQREAEIGLRTTPPEKFGVRYRPFIGYSVMGRNLTIEKLQKAVSNIGENKLAELMVHPGYVSKGSKFTYTIFFYFHYLKSVDPLTDKWSALNLSLEKILLIFGPFIGLNFNP